MKVRLVVDRWDQPVGGGYEQHVKGDVVDVAAEIGEWLVDSGSGVVVEAAPVSDSPKPTPSKRSRRKQSAN